MLNKDAFNDIATKISEALPEPARKMQAQFKQQAEDLIAQGLKDLNVVTREDYDKQAEKLSKAEAKLAELSKNTPGTPVINAIKSESLKKGLGVFEMLGFIAVACGLLLFVIGRPLKKWMHGIN